MSGGSSLYQNEILETVFRVFPIRVGMVGSLPTSRTFALSLPHLEKFPPLKFNSPTKKQFPCYNPIKTSFLPVVSAPVVFNFIIRGGSRNAATSKMELFLIIVNVLQQSELHLGCCSSPRSASDTLCTHRS